MKKAALGKGLGALIGDELSTAPGKPFEEIDIQLLDTDQNQPRKNFDPEKLEELAQSIRTHGVMQPLLVTQNGSRYTIIAGERRYRAARLAGHLAPLGLGLGRLRTGLGSQVGELEVDPASQRLEVADTGALAV